jgi:hypothetical protein
MYVIEISLADDGLLADYMTNASEWLQLNRILPKTFRYIFEPPGVVFRVDFGLAEEAMAFAARFPGATTYVADPPSLNARSGSLARRQ